jgi:hypothetical protein
MKHWDGIDYQICARFTITLSVGCLIVERLWVHDSELFRLAIIFLLFSLAMVPKGPQSAD